MCLALRDLEALCGGTYCKAEERSDKVSTIYIGCPNFDTIIEIAISGTMGFGVIGIEPRGEVPADKDVDKRTRIRRAWTLKHSINPIALHLSF